MSKDTQIPGQYSFIARGTELVIDNTAQLEYESKLRQAIIAYYTQYLDLLDRYGKYNKYYGPWLSLISENPSSSAKAFLMYHMNNDMVTLEDRLQKTNHWLKVSMVKLAEEAKRVGVRVNVGFSEAYRDPKRRTAYRGYIRREIEKVKAEKTLEIYTPEDLEARYQTNLARRSRRKGSE